MKTFIRAVEIWLPSQDQSLLEFGGGLFGEAANFAAISRSMCFGRGEGLPGRAWEEGRPLVLKQFEGSYFRRQAAAAAAGLSCGIAMPVFLGDTLRAVLVFFCGGSEAHAGAIELWRNNPRVTTDMTLVDGYFGSTATTFQADSRETFLPRGSGLPGMAWQRGAAVFIDDLGRSVRFVRAEQAAEAGIQRGLAMPCSTPGDEAYVLSFLSTLDTPIAGRIESWAPDDGGGALQRVFGFCEAQGGLDAAAGEIVLGAEQGCIGDAFVRAVPVLCDALAAEPGRIGAVAGETGLGALVAIPIISEGVVSEVVVLYF
jgi:hypothetical protein